MLYNKLPGWSVQPVPPCAPILMPMLASCLALHSVACSRSFEDQQRLLCRRRMYVTHACAAWHVQTCTADPCMQQHSRRLCYGSIRADCLGVLSGCVVGTQMAIGPSSAQVMG